MIKVRLSGTMEEIEQAVFAIEEAFNVISKSSLYPNRDSTVCYRQYLECELK